MKNRQFFNRFMGVFVCLAIVFSICTFFASASDVAEKTQALPEMTKQERLKGTIYLQNLNYAAACDGVLTVINPNDKTITPLFRENEFYVPLRFVLEHYGVKVSWEHETKTVIMMAGEKEYRLSTKDSVMSIGENTKQLPNSCFIINGTTYVDFDDIAKIINCKIYYFNSYNAGVIAVGEEWNSERQAEQDALRAMEFAVSPFFKMFT
ncbi:MAG: copper amine oxidase N-terminal domain-containing protein [Clostridia bacterium]|nr:copper amine oxidase N-terminal domain-containing protein [Clostridia bacterium]